MDDVLPVGWVRANASAVVRASAVDVVTQVQRADGTKSLLWLRGTEEVITSKLPQEEVLAAISKAERDEWLAQTDIDLDPDWGAGAPMMGGR